MLARWVRLATLLAALAGGTCGADRPQPAQMTPLPAATTSQPAAPVRSPPQEADLREVYRRASPAVVSIDVLVEAVTPFLERTVRPAAGSGFVLDSQGLVVTNNHVVENARLIRVTFQDGTQAQAELVGADPVSDLAVLRVELQRELPTLPLGDSDGVEVGEQVAAIGNPFGLGGTLTHGVVSAVGRTVPQEEMPFGLPQAIQTDAPINPGNSGGPLLNMAGEVIGVNTAIRSPTGVSAGIGFAVPSNLVARVVPQLVSRGRVDWPWMGVVMVSVSRFPELAEIHGLADARGAYVHQVEAGSPAERAGLRGSERVVNRSGVRLPSGGDVILAVDGRPLRGPDDLVGYMVVHKSPGDRLRLTVWRAGEQLEVELTLGTRPDRLDREG